MENYFQPWGFDISKFYLFMNEIGIEFGIEFEFQYICFSSTFKYMWSQTNQHVRKCENQVSPVNSLDLF